MKSKTLPVLFVVYLVLLVWAFVWKFELPYVGAAAGVPRPIKLVPFIASGDAGPSAPLEVVANLLLFVPFGIYLRALAPTWRWWRPMALAAAASLVLEVTQHLISVGSFDLTDVIVNIIGGALGWVILARVGRRSVTRVMLVATVVAVLAAGAFVASPLHYAQPRDIVVPSPNIPY